MQWAISQTKLKKAGNFLGYDIVVVLYVVVFVVEYVWDIFVFMVIYGNSIIGLDERVEFDQNGCSRR